MKKHLPFFIKFFSVILMTIAILIPANMLYTAGDTYNGTYIGIEKFEDIPEGIQYANFGPSYGMSCFNYDSMAENNKVGFNFALTMQDLYHDFSVLQMYGEKLNEGCIVALPLSYFSFCQNTEEASGNRYYKILSQKYIQNFTLERYLSANFLPVYGNGKALLRDTMSLIVTPLLRKSGSQSVESNAAVSPSASDELQRLSSDSASRVAIIENGNLIPYQVYIKRNTDILIQMINYCRENGFVPVLVLTPYYHEYANGFDPELLNESFIKPLNYVLEQTDVPYINFNDESIAEFYQYIRTPAFFSNCDHVSEEGSKAFMELYEEQLFQNTAILEEAKSVSGGEKTF